MLFRTGLSCTLHRDLGDTSDPDPPNRKRGKPSAPNVKRVQTTCGALPKLMKVTDWDEAMTKTLVPGQEKAELEMEQVRFVPGDILDGNSVMAHFDLKDSQMATQTWERKHKTALGAVICKQACSRLYRAWESN